MPPLQFIHKRTTFNILHGPVQSDHGTQWSHGDPMIHPNQLFSSWTGSLGHILSRLGRVNANLSASFLFFVVHIWPFHQHLPDTWTNSSYWEVLKSHSYNRVIGEFLCAKNAICDGSPPATHIHTLCTYFMWLQRLFVSQENYLVKRYSSQSLTMNVKLWRVSWV